MPRRVDLQVAGDGVLDIAVYRDGLLLVGFRLSDIDVLLESVLIKIIQVSPAQLQYMILNAVFIVVTISR